MSRKVSECVPKNINVEIVKDQSMGSMNLANQLERLLNECEEQFNKLEGSLCSVCRSVPDLPQDSRPPSCTNRSTLSCCLSAMADKVAIFTQRIKRVQESLDL